MTCGCSSTRSYTLQLIDRIEHNSDTYSFDFVPLEPMEWREGDSAKVFMPMEGNLIGKKFSFASLPDEKLIRFTTRIRVDRSDYKNRMDQMKIGDFIEVSQPQGHFSLVRDNRPALLLSNGVGIATMRSLIKAFEKDQSEVNRMTQVNVDASGTLYFEELDALSNQLPQFKSIYTKHRSDFYNQVDYASQEMMFATGMVPYFYIVGSDTFVQSVSAYLVSVGFDWEDILTDGTAVSGGCGCSSEDSAGCGCGGESSCGCGGEVDQCDSGKYDFSASRPTMTLSRTNI